MITNGNFDEFNSLNGGISMCLKALSGVLVRHGLKETISRAESALLAEINNSAQNDLFFLCRGLKALNAPMLEEKVQLAASHYRAMTTKAECFSMNGNCFQEIDKQWKKATYQAKQVFMQFGKWCNKEYFSEIDRLGIGVVNQLARARFIEWMELDADIGFFNYLDMKNTVDQKASELFVFVEEKYVCGHAPESMSIKNLAGAIEALGNKCEELCRILRKDGDLWGAFEAAQFQYRESFSELAQELAKLPLSSQWGLFRYCSPKFAREGHFPDLFALENLKPAEL